jgi:ABC-type polysaccharide/polyol phosphate export permease
MLCQPLWTVLLYLFPILVSDLFVTTIGWVIASVFLHFFRLSSFLLLTLFSVPVCFRIHRYSRSVLRSHYVGLVPHSSIFGLMRVPVFEWLGAFLCRFVRPLYLHLYRT